MHYGGSIYKIGVIMALQNIEQIKTEKGIELSKGYINILYVGFTEKVREVS